jgi:hypothetical protein
MSGMSDLTILQKLFLLLVLGYLVVKGVFALLIYLVSKKVEEKGKRLKKKKKSPNKTTL